MIPPPIVSVVIPAYNAAAFIEKTIDSVLAQTFKSFEIIVVDDGSADQTADVVERHSRRHAWRGRRLVQENKKIAAARNAGMLAAQGAYIALLDHDDLWYPDKLESVMKEFELHSESGLVCHREHVFEAGRAMRVTPLGPAAANMYERLLFGGNALSTSACVFRKDLAAAVGGFRENPKFDTVEDYDFWMRMSRVTVLRFLDRVLGRAAIVERAASRRIEYHHSNLESLLRDHFASYLGDNPGLLRRLQTRKRLAAVHRSALGAFMAQGTSPDKEREHLSKMLREFPWDLKNLARAALWAGRGLCP